MRGYRIMTTTLFSGAAALSTAPRTPSSYCRSGTARKGFGKEGAAELQPVGADAIAEDRADMETRRAIGGGQDLQGSEHRHHRQQLLGIAIDKQERRAAVDQIGRASGTARVCKYG